MANLEKLPDWQDRLNALIRERMEVEFNWETNNCMTWVADALLVQTGVDCLEAYRNKYKTASGAVRALRRIDGVSLPIELMDKLWGDRIHISSAKLGDPVVIAEGMPPGMGPSVGICYGRNSLFVGSDGSERGLVRVPTLSLEHCYIPWASSQKQ